MLRFMAKPVQPRLGSQHPPRHVPLLLPRLRQEDPPSNHTAPWHPRLVNEGLRCAMGPAQMPRTMGEIISFIAIAGRLAFVDN